MRKALFVVAMVLFVLGILAFTVLVGVSIGPAMWASIGPATFLFLLADGTGMSVDPNGSIIGHAHGPPFLQPMGILLVYFVPAAVALYVALDSRKQARNQS